MKVYCKQEKKKGSLKKQTIITVKRIEKGKLRGFTPQLTKLGCSFTNLFHATTGTVCNDTAGPEPNSCLGDLLNFVSELKKINWR